MSDSKVAVYQSLVGLSFALILMFALIAGTLGVVSICQKLVKSEIRRPDLVARDLN